MAAAGFEGTIEQLRQLELLAGGTSRLHTFDPRAKLLVSLLFIVLVVSCQRYDLTILLPFFCYPVFTAAQAGLSLRLIAVKILPVLPFVLLLGSANLFFDQHPQPLFGTITIGGGWLSLLVLLVRTVLTVSAAVLLVATTGIMDISLALQQLGMPRALVVQLFFMVRYLFVLAEDAAMAVRARRLRSFGSKGMEWRPFAAMLTHLLLRSWERAERIHMAMLARGGGWCLQTNSRFRFGGQEWCYLAGWGGLFILFREVNLPQLLGNACLQLLALAGGAR